MKVAMGAERNGALLPFHRGRPRHRRRRQSNEEVQLASHGCYADAVAPDAARWADERDSLMTTQAYAGLDEAIRRSDALVRRCASGDLEFEAFLVEYNNFYDHWALDGHEGGASVLRAHRAAIEFHRRVRDEVLYIVCSQSDAKRDIYRSAGRIGPDEAVARLAQLVAEWAAFGT